MIEQLPVPNFSGVYAIRCVPTGKVYVGSAVWIAKRWRHHREALRKGTHHSAHLQKAWDKHGEESFEFSVISAVEKERLIVEEQAHIDALRAHIRDYGFNMNPRAGSNLGRKFGPAVGKKISDARRGVPLSESHRAACSKALIGNTRALGSKHSDEVKAKIQAARAGKIYGPRKPMTQAHRDNIGKAFKGKVLTEQHKAKIGASHVGKKQSAELRRRIALAQKKVSDDSLVNVRRLLAEGVSCRRIAREVGCSAQTICNIKNGVGEIYK